MDVTVGNVPVINPSDLPTGEGYRRSRGGLFKMNTHGDRGYVWTDTNYSYDDAFEEWVEYLDEESPSVFVTVDEDALKEAAADLGEDWKDTWPDWSDPDFEKVAEYAEADLDVIGHTTLKSGTHIPKDAWSFETIDRDSREYEEVWCACAKAYFADNGEWPDKPDGIKCPEMSGWKMDDDLDGAPSGVPSKRSVPAWIRRG